LTDLFDVLEIDPEEINQMKPKFKKGDKFMVTTEGTIVDVTLLPGRESYYFVTFPQFQVTSTKVFDKKARLAKPAKKKAAKKGKTK